MRKFAAIFILMAMMIPAAHAQKGLPRLPDPLGIGDHNENRGAISSKLMSPDQLWEKIVDPAILADLKYASALAGAAKTNSSLVRKQCLDAIIAVNQQVAAVPTNPDGTPMAKPDPSLITHLEQGAEVIDSLAPGGPLVTACAGAAGLFRMQVLQVIQGVVTGTIAAATVAPIIP